MSNIIFIDPQSYNNLSMYDKGVLSSFEKGEVTFIGSKLWNCSPMTNVDSRLWFTYNSIKNPLLKLASYMGTLLKIIRLIQRDMPNIVHIEWIRVPVIDQLFAKWLKRQGIKVVYTAHNILPHNSGENYKSQYKKYYQLVDKIIVHSLTTKLELIEMFQLNPSTIEVIPHGIIDIEVEKGVDVKSRMETLKNNLKLNGKIIFSSLGAQGRYKGIDNIVDVWSGNEELANNSRCHLIIAGKNSDIDFSPIENLSNVTIINERLSNCDFLSFIKLSDVILLPYIKISQSGVLFSAISNNIPVIVSNAGGLTDPLSYGKIGWCIGSPSRKNLSKCLLSLVNNKEEIEKLKNDKNSFNAVKSIYSWSNISSMTKKLYHSLISNSDN